jgi:hypothetical protein
MNTLEQAFRPVAAVLHTPLHFWGEALREDRFRHDRRNALDQPATILPCREKNFLLALEVLR